jgi:hypothetical protein
MKQGVDGRGLEEAVRGASPLDEVLLLQVFDVQRVHERGIYGHMTPLGSVSRLQNLILPDLICALKPRPVRPG